MTVLLWWSLLCSVALLNVVAWGFSARLLKRRRADFSPPYYATRRLLLWLAAGYVFGCGFRSVLPMVDAPRICLHDTEVSRIVIGRSVATIAELCFAAQFALLLREAARTTGRRVLGYLSPGVLLLIVVAEAFSWFAVLTTNNLLHAIENSLWTLTAAITVAAFTSLRSQVDTRGARFLAAILVCGVAYIAFMSTVDVPMYLSRWQAGLAAGREPLSLAEGLREILSRCTVVRDWTVWSVEVPWLTFYFSTGVWISVLLAHAPPLPSAHPRAMTAFAAAPATRF